MRLIRNFTLALPLFLAACTVPAGPVEVARFHLPEGTPDLARLGHGSIAVVAGTGMNPASTDLQSFEIAVEQQLARLGYTPASPDTADQIAQVRVLRSAVDSASQTSFGFSAAGSNHASAVGVGVGMGGAIPIGTTQRIATDLVVVIRDRASGKVLWEGRAALTLPATSPLAKTALAAPKLAGALLDGFPGKSGETVIVP